MLISCREEDARGWLSSVCPPRLLPSCHRPFSTVQNHFHVWRDDADSSGASERPDGSFALVKQLS